MANYSFSEKAATTKLTKIQRGQQVRDIRVQREKIWLVQQGEPYDKNICGGCGFRIRGQGHLEGAHHNGVVPACHRGR